MQAQGPILDTFRARSDATGENSYYVPLTTMFLACQEALRGTGRPDVSLNRPQAQSQRLVHTLKWGRLTLISTSDSPISVRLG